MTSEDSAGINLSIPKTDRHLFTKGKQAIKDSEISKQIIIAYDIQNNPELAFEIFYQNRNRLSDQVYWIHLKQIWIISGNLKNREIFKKLFKSKRPFSYYFMTPEEEKQLNDMPDKIHVYRAAYNENDGGLSWTIDKNFAIEYMKKTGNRILIKKIVNKKDIFAFIDRRGESEILII